MRTISDIETSQRREAQSRIRSPLVNQVRREIAAGTYEDTNMDDAINAMVASGDLSSESTPQPTTCCICHSPLNGIAYGSPAGWKCYSCGLEDQRRRPNDRLDDPDDRIEHAERFDGLS